MLIIDIIFSLFSIQDNRCDKKGIEIYYYFISDC
jgi:hypothetical protein